MEFLVFGGNQAVFKGFDGNCGVKSFLPLPKTPALYAHTQQRKCLNDARVESLRKYNATGSFSPHIVNEIRNNPDIARQAAWKLLEEYFPKSLHQDILERVGFDYIIFSPDKRSNKKRKRDRKFREDVLTEYKYSCAVCGFDLHRKDRPVGLEAAHIKWHKEGGPDTLDNGLALCATHHKLFDLGALTLSTDHRIILSKWIHSPNNENGFIEQFRERKIKLPTNREHLPSLDYIRWHWKAVFKEAINEVSSLEC